MSFSDPTTPNVTDFGAFITDQGVTAAQLPTNSAYISYAFNFAMQMALVPPDDLGPGLSGYADIYVMAVYNLGFHQLLKITPDQSNETFFSDSRSKYKLLSFTAGVISASSDESTSQTTAVPEGLKNMTITAIDLTKTPWGTFYLQYAQSYGPNIVGVS